MIDLQHDDLPPTLALIAHDAKKDALVAFARRHLDVLRRFRLIATGTTGTVLRDRLDLDVERKLSGPLGGDVQIASRIVEGHVYAVLFFVDPLGKHPHEPDIRAIQRVCNVHDVPLAMNPATARFLLAPQRAEELIDAPAVAAARRVTPGE
jgi:methylglyoxal synthase